MTTQTQASPKIVPEPELIARARTGDPDAFATLYNDHERAVFRYIVARVGHRQIAEDLTSETFLRAWRRVTTNFIWQGNDFGAWLSVIARNLVNDLYKSSRHRREVLVDEMLDHESDHAPSVEQTLIARDGSADLYTLLGKLTEQQRQILALRYLGGLSVADTATHLGLTLGAVKSGANRGTHAMRRQLQMGEAA
ncbi:sigma-70 family RNA polymerase sigma factor [Streptomyces sp. NPDC050738]|uniref:RNA polymerase sigma factor n=1 Tax=Streptomyces sp. NPDC050738 TaxID=3154744 RepID=UPI0034200522